MAGDYTPEDVSYSIFLEDYLRNFNISHASREAGKSPQWGSKIFHDEAFQLVLKDRIEELRISTDILYIELGRTITESRIASVINLDTGELDYMKAQATGGIDHIHKLSPGKYGTVIEMEDRLRAIELYGKFIGLAKDVQSINLNVKGYIGISPDDFDEPIEGESSKPD